MSDPNKHYTTSEPNKPYTTEPLHSSTRANGARSGAAGTAWVVSGILGAVVIGALVFWGMAGNGNRVADTTPPASKAQTTGVTTPAAPTNPSTNPSQNQSTTPPARAQ